MRWVALLLLLMGLSNCGYRSIAWSSARFGTLEIRAITTGNRTASMAIRLEDALVERCLAGSGLKPVQSDADLVLTTRLNQYDESVIATGSDGRTSRLQYVISVTFELSDRAGQRLWHLDNYQYSDQYEISIAQHEYRDETVFEQDQALRAISDLVITNITLAIAELERTGE